MASKLTLSLFFVCFCFVFLTPSSFFIFSLFGIVNIIVNVVSYKSGHETGKMTANARIKRLRGLKALLNVQHTKTYRVFVLE